MKNLHHVIGETIGYELADSMDAPEVSQSVKPCHVMNLFCTWQGNKYRSIDLYVEGQLEYKLAKEEDILGSWYNLQHIPTRRNQLLATAADAMRAVAMIEPEKIRFSPYRRPAPWLKRLETAGRDLPRYRLNKTGAVEEIESLSDYWQVQDRTMALEYYSAMVKEYGDEWN